MQAEDYISMSMLLKLFKRAFCDNRTIEVDGVEVWSEGEYSLDKQEVAEFFVEEDAIAFKDALVDAFKLTRNRMNSVKISRGN